MQHVKRKTKIPIPAVVLYDASKNNALGHEFTLLEKMPGLSADRAWHGLELEGKNNLLLPLAEYLEQLHTLNFQGMGGHGVRP
jgi:hypothetical protein